VAANSVEQVIQEEIAKAAKADSLASEGSPPKDSETQKALVGTIGEADPVRLRELEKEILDLKITNRGKDYFIEELQKERESLALER